MKIEELDNNQLIKFCEIRLNYIKKDFSEILIEDASFKHYNGVTFLIKSDNYRDELFHFSFEMFYPTEFYHLINLGVKF